MVASPPCPGAPPGGRLIFRTALFLGRILAALLRRAFDIVRLTLYTLVVHWWLAYGDRSLRVLFVAGGFVVGFGLLYYLAGDFTEPDSDILVSLSRREALYYSLLSFTAVGYGSWVSTPLGWARYAGAVEAALGITSVALAAASLFRWLQGR